jgi:Flagellar hook-length control protein FliK
MPSSVPVVGGDSSPDGGQPFSEVLSLSTPPGGTGPSGSALPPEPSQSPGEAGDDKSAVAATGPEVPATGTAGSSRERAQRRSGSPERGEGHARRVAGSAPVGSAGTTDLIPPPGSTHLQAGGVPLDVDQSPGTSRALASSALRAAPGPRQPSTVEAPFAPDEQVGVGAGSEAPGTDAALSTLALAQNAPDPSPVATAAAQELPPTLGAGSTGEGTSDNRAATDVPAGRAAVARGVADPAPVPDAAGLLSGPVRTLAKGAAPGAEASALSGMTPGTHETTVVPAEEGLELGEVPDGGGTTGVDIGNLAAAISRPLTMGSGDYSVQVSLHPPELGEVRALLSLQGDVLHVTLTPEHSNGFDALSEAMPALHEQLAGGGVEVHVSLGQPGDPEGGHGRGGPEGRPAGTARRDDTPPIVSDAAVPRASDPGRIHLVL